MVSADVVVVGGGVNGASTAFHLTQLGVKNVVLLERGTLASGATGKSGALVRTHYTNEHEARLAFESLKVFRNFDAMVGGECGFEALGFLQLVPRGYEAAIRQNVETQRRLGIKTELVSHDDLRRIVPGIHVDDVGGAAWAPDSGFADPNAPAFAFAEAAQRRGARIETGREATAVRVERGRVTGVETRAGRVDAPVVVLVPGAWAGRLLAPLGLDFGLEPFRVQGSIFRWPAGVARRHPVGVDAGRKPRRGPGGGGSTPRASPGWTDSTTAGSGCRSGASLPKSSGGFLRLGQVRATHARLHVLEDAALEHELDLVVLHVPAAHGRDPAEATLLPRHHAPPAVDQHAPVRGGEPLVLLRLRDAQAQD